MIPNVTREVIDLGDGRTISIETGKLAKQADGSVVVRLGDCMLLATAVSARTANPGVDFLPLTVDYREKFAAAGRFPGGFFKRGLDSPRANRPTHIIRSSKIKKSRKRLLALRCSITSRKKRTVERPKDTGLGLVRKWTARGAARANPPIPKAQKCKKLIGPPQLLRTTKKDRKTSK